MTSTLYEAINQYETYIDTGKADVYNFILTKKEARQHVNWLKELNKYREILANADKIIESDYGCVIVEGYKDVIDRMIDMFKEVNVDKNILEY